jgi:putative ATPase
MILAQKYRPKTLDEIIGQNHVVGEGAPLRKLIEANALPHLFLFGPPGCGKTTLARIIATLLDRPFFEFNATSLKIEELRKIFKTHAHALQKPLIFIDEVHRLSKNQQEVLLPFMESDAALIIGASTENPYYAMTAAIRSRSHLFELKTINPQEMDSFLKVVLEKEAIETNQEVHRYLIESSGGDVRAMLNLLESGMHVATPITLDVLKSIRPHALQSGSSEADSHYDLTSAMIKSIRGSDVDAGIYYLARLISGGEPPEFIARRLAILASEDIGNANPNALNLAASTLTIVKQIGFPEARIPLAQLVVYLASSPKSNSSYLAINDALNAIESGEIHPVPTHLKTHSKSYRYPHDHGGWVPQTYVEQEMVFYRSKRAGFEVNLDDWLRKIKSEKLPETQ